MSGITTRPRHNREGCTLNPFPCSIKICYASQKPISRFYLITRKKSRKIIKTTARPEAASLVELQMKSMSHDPRARVNGSEKFLRNVKKSNWKKTFLFVFDSNEQRHQALLFEFQTSDFMFMRKTNFWGLELDSIYHCLGSLLKRKILGTYERSNELLSKLGSFACKLIFMVHMWVV